jgi:energy-converting hydrogenase Eha subunit G
MATPSVDGKAIINTAYHGAVVTGLSIGAAKLTKMIFKGATLPKLDADAYDAGMLVLDISVALAIKDVLVRQGIIPADIMK